MSRYESMGRYVYIRSEPGLFTVGFYEGGEWFPESDWNDSEDAARRVHYLNGGAAPEGEQ